MEWGQVRPRPAMSRKGLHPVVAVLGGIVLATFAVFAIAWRLVAGERRRVPARAR